VTDREPRMRHRQHEHELQQPRPSLHLRHAPILARE
jgi:hypothetical protein